jgi:raffinose/stachyose/melibiose transport system substrate-binding protein
MQTMKRKIVLALVLCAVTMLTAACRGKKSAAPAAETGGISGTLTIWEGDPIRIACVEAYVEALKDDYPNLTILYEGKTENTYNSALTTAFAGGAGPDVFWNWGTKNGILRSQVQEGNVIPLTGIVDMSLFEKDGQKTMVSGICYVDDVLYAVPTSCIDTRTVYYNKDIFEQYGYKPTTNSKEFEALCAQIMKDGIQPLTIAATEFSSIFHVLDFLLCTQDGGPQYIWDAEALKARVNDPRCVAALERLYKWRDNGWFSKSSSANTASAAVLEFATGGTAMIICGSWLLETVRSSNEDLNFGVFKLANDADGKTYASVTANGGYSIAADSKNKAAAEMFVKWMSTVEGQQVFINASGAIPSLPETVAQDEVAYLIGQADVQIQGFYELLGPTANNGQPARILEENLVNSFGGRISARDFLNMVAAEQDKIPQ